MHKDSITITMLHESAKRPTCVGWLPTDLVLRAACFARRVVEMNVREPASGDVPSLAQLATISISAKQAP